MFEFLKNKKEVKGLREVVEILEKTNHKIEELSQRISELEKDNERILTAGVVRYNAFSQTGGNQSFSLALIDEEESGFVVTSLYRDDKSRIFIKPIEEGKSEYKLSPEEKKAINRAAL